MRSFHIAMVPGFVFALAIGAWVLVKREPLPLYPTLMIGWVVMILSWYLSRRHRTRDGGKSLVIAAILVASSVLSPTSDARTIVDDGHDVAIEGFTYDMWGRPTRFEKLINGQVRVAEWFYKGTTMQVVGVKIDGVSVPVSYRPMARLVSDLDEWTPSGDMGGGVAGGGFYGDGGGGAGGGGGTGGGGGITPAQCDLMCDLAFGAASVVCGYVSVDPPLGAACFAGELVLYGACRISCRP
jgi:hypothetical protein